MRIAFQTNQLSLYGTEIALYDYAYFNETLLDNESYVVVKEVHTFPHDKTVIDKFTQRFPNRVYFYKNPDDLERYLLENKIDVFYSIKAGVNDGVMSKNIKNCMHSVFQFFEPHGDVYAYVSEWLSNKMTNGKYPFVPHMINLPDTDKNWRSQLGIPVDAVVLGRYGNYNSFNIPFVLQCINDVMDQRPDLYLLLVHTSPSCELNRNLIIKTHNRIKYLPSISDLTKKVEFINTCDAMLHARINGESFGLAIGEFASKNKQIITWTGKDVQKYYHHAHDTAHLEMLGDKGIYYNDYNDIKNILLTFKPDKTQNWNVYSDKYNPEVVMKKFKEVFL
jgi:hypothetical protein